MELLTKQVRSWFLVPAVVGRQVDCLSGAFQGWSSAYSIESVIMQINATLVKGKARVQFGANKVKADSFHRRVPRQLLCLIVIPACFPEPVQSRQSTAVVQIPCADSRKER